MRVTKKNSTKTERIVAEVLKDLHILFRHRWLVQGREIDFIIGKLALEIDGHDQDETKNDMLAQEGFTPIHLHNSEVTRTNIINLLNDYKTFIR
jgi:very-short-patch-repair endonuclease